jgi:hypothetical protein
MDIKSFSDFADRSKVTVTVTLRLSDGLASYKNHIQ